MKSEIRKQLLIQLYRSIETLQKVIESSMDNLADNGNSAEFEILLLDLVELSIQLIKNHLPN